MYIYIELLPGSRSMGGRSGFYRAEIISFYIETVRSVCPMNGWLQTYVNNVSHRLIWAVCFDFFSLKLD